jgi:hypothetical protein
VTWLVALAAILWLGRLALKLWIDGPEVRPTPEPWPPLPAGGVDQADGPEGATRAQARKGSTGLATVTPTPTGPATVTPTPTGPATAGAAAGDPTAAIDRAGPAPSPPASPTAIDRAGPAPSPPASPTAAADPDPTPTSVSTWVAAEPDGSAPPSHPIKAKLSSRLYHLPGMAAYGRTRPDRCYQTPEAAEADGFARAKR